MTKESRQNRRSFLRKSAAAAAAVGFPAIVPNTVFGQNAPNSRINIGLIGCGGMGRHHLGEIKSQPGAETIALCDVRAEQIAEAQKAVAVPEENTYSDFREMIQRPDLDAVFIATPDHWHVLQAMHVMRAGKQVYCQKPLSQTIREGRVLSDMTKQYGVTFQVGSQQRSSGWFRQAAELVRNGMLGKIKKIEVGLERPYFQEFGVQPTEEAPPGVDYDMWLGPAPWKPFSWERVIHFRNSFDYSGGYLSDWGAHHFDIAQWALGMDESGPVEADGKGTFHDSGIFDVPMDFDVTYRYADGTVMHAGLMYENGIRFIGEEGWVFVSRQRIEANPAELLNTPIPASGTHLYASPHHIANFLECMRTGRQPIVTAETGHRSATVCHIGNISMRLGRPVRWNPEAEAFVNDDQANRMRFYAMRRPWRLS